MLMKSMNDKIVHYLDAQFPILYINTFEETKVDGIIKKVTQGREVLEWNAAKGFVDFNTKRPLVGDNRSLQETLQLLQIDDELNGKIIVLKDIHHFLDNPLVIGILKDIALRIYQGMGATIFMVSPVINIPIELEKYITFLEIDYMEVDDIKHVVNSFITVNELTEISTDLLEQMAIAFKGLTEFEIINILSLAYSTDGSLSRQDLRLILEQKHQIVKKSGILDMIPLKESFEDIGGLENLKKWLQKKGIVFKNLNKAQEFGVDIPKGVLIAGMPGCGKSLNAKAAAHLFDVPLLRLDMGRLLGKYVGESEANLRKAIRLAEAISPCVLWIDELEKAFAGIGDSGNSEVITRLFGNFLTWMQEKESAAFVVATANDILKLPPELMRKGRFDEIFYVGLPNDEERKRIFEIHIAKRRKVDLPKININELVQKTKGYSGADIEGVVKDSVEAAFAAGKLELMTAEIVEAINNTHSLSEIMKEPLEKMSKEYETRKFKNASV